MVNYDKMQEIVYNANNRVKDELHSYSSDNPIEKLRRAYQNRKLVLVLGAGISREYGLPSWDVLLQKLLLRELYMNSKNSSDESHVLAKIFTELFDTSPLIAARYLKNQYNDNSNNVNADKFNDTNITASFKFAVREIIYDEVRKNVDSATFSEIAKLCGQFPGGPALDSIITYNYDDILEMSLSDLNLGTHRRYKPIYSSSIKHEDDEIPVYHVHGYLPRMSHLCSDDIILSEDVYHQQYNDPINWSNFIQISKFSTNTCLFIGISLTDPNLRRLLDISKKLRNRSDIQHYIIRARYNRVKAEEKLRFLLRYDQDLMNAKIDADMAFNSTNNCIIQMMENFQKNDAASFNIGTIWVDDYATGIPDKLKAIRSQDM